MFNFYFSNSSPIDWIQTIAAIIQAIAASVGIPFAIVSFKKLIQKNEEFEKAIIELKSLADTNLKKYELDKQIYLNSLKPDLRLTASYQDKTISIKITNLGNTAFLNNLEIEEGDNFIVPILTENIEVPKDRNKFLNIDNRIQKIAEVKDLNLKVKFTLEDRIGNLYVQKFSIDSVFSLKLEPMQLEIEMPMR
jgi:hypothetical protein